jgi:hypothetical protein
MPTLPQNATILAVDPTSRGFAFAMLEVPNFLVDWGERIVPAAKRGDVLSKVDDLLTYYRPAVLALEDVAAKGCQRRRRAKEEIERMELLARARGVRVQRVSRRAVRDAPAPGEGKYAVALRLAKVFPVLGDRLPRRRKAWMSEDPRINIFDAIGFAVALQAQSKQFGAMQNRKLTRQLKLPRPRPSWNPTSESWLDEGGLFKAI